MSQTQSLHQLSVKLPIVPLHHHLHFHPHQYHYSYNTITKLHNCNLYMCFYISIILVYYACSHFSRQPSQVRRENWLVYDNDNSCIIIHELIENYDFIQSPAEREVNSQDLTHSSSLFSQHNYAVLPFFLRFLYMHFPSAFFCTLLNS